MTLAIAIFVSLVVGFFGLYKVNKVGNYETVWGILMISGAVSTLVFSLVSIGSFLLVIL